MTQEIITQITDTVGTEVFGIRFLNGADFVIIMHSGISIQKKTFTISKKSGN